MKFLRAISRIVIALAFTSFILAGFYTIKSKFGIDIDQSHHLRYYFFHPLSLISLAMDKIKSLPHGSDHATPLEFSPPEAHIVVYPHQSEGKVNRNVFGLNILGIQSPWMPVDVYSNFGAGLWNPATRAALKEPLDLAKEIGVSTLRFPGGAGTRSYDWKKAVEENRSSFLFGIDEFMEIARRLGAEPVFTLSYFIGGPQDAADLVEYLNSTADAKHPWAMKRKSKGLLEGYGVKYFELGNEVDYGNDKDKKEVLPEQYALNFLRYAEAMKKIDPNVKLGADFYKSDWNKAIMEIIGDKIDFAIVHIYPTPTWGEELKTIPAKTIFASALSIPLTQTTYELQELKTLLKKFAGKDVPIFVTEYNGGFAQDQPVPYRHTLGNALVNAELIRLFLEPANHIQMAHYWNFINEYWGMIANGFQGSQTDLRNRYYKRPNFYTFEIYHKHFGDEIIATDVTAPQYDVGRDGFYCDFIGKYAPGDSDGSNLLNTPWDIFPVEGINAKQQNGILSLNFGNHKQWNYYHSVIYAKVEPDTFYRLSGYIKTVNLQADSGVSLEVQDARGWTTTQSAASTEKLNGNTDWRYVEIIYRTLPDASGVKVFARRVGEKGPLKGEAYFKNVELKKFIPSVSSKIPYLSVIASKNLNSDRIFLLVINKNFEKEITSTIELKDFMPANSAQSWVLNGPSLESTNEVNHGNVKVTHKSFSVSHNPFQFSFQPHSLTVVEIEGKHI